jgi:hypothetical protein
MAGLSQQEFHRALDRLSGKVGFDRLKDRLGRLGAFTSKRGLGSVDALAERLYMLTGGLRREGVASMGFHSLWNEVFTARVAEEDEKAIGEVADRINACLEPDQSIHPEKLAALDTELASYHRLLARAVGDDIARLDMLMKAVPAIAERIRCWPGDAPPETVALPDAERAAKPESPLE